MYLTWTPPIELRVSSVCGSSREDKKVMHFSQIMSLMSGRGTFPLSMHLPTAATLELNPFLESNVIFARRKYTIDTRRDFLKNNLIDLIRNMKQKHSDI